LTKVAGTLASMLELEAAKRSEPRSMPLMTQLRSAIRMSVDTEIMDRSEEIEWRGKSDWDISAEILRMVRLPHNPCWLEWRPMEIDPNDHDRAGMLIYMESGVLRVAVAFIGHGNDAFWCPVYAYASSTGGLGVKWMWGKTEVRDPEMWERAAVTALGIASRLLILLTARNSPLSVEPMQDFERLNKLRAKAGKTPLLSYRPVRWAVTRVERRIGRDLSPTERAEVVGHLCRGHLKLRKSGAFWWSPHWRGLGTNPAPEGGRDHKVRM